VIPREKIGMDPGQLTWKQGVQDLIDTVKIKHRSGGWSKLGLKSYQQGRGSFEGTAQHVVWDDEEPPEDVYGEQIIRTATTGGILMLTFTPLEGMSEVVQRFLPGMGVDDE
jgi:phage terminase large subunit-like protein